MSAAARALRAGVQGRCFDLLCPMDFLPVLLLTTFQALPQHLSPYTGAWHCAVRSASEEGAAVFAKGLGATMGRGFIVNAAIFASFETLMKAMA